MEYRTIAARAQAEFVEKRSRFLGLAAPVSTAEAAAEMVAQVRAQHHDARHNVYAYRLRAGEKRYSDDGEPQGTAGQPILEVLEKSGYTDILVVVTRYFGGILLGAGGLVRAYSNTAALALGAAQSVVMQEHRLFTVPTPYAEYASLKRLLLRCGGQEKESRFAERVEVDALLPLERADAFLRGVTELSAGRIIPQERGTCFVALPQQEDGK